MTEEVSNQIDINKSLNQEPDAGVFCTISDIAYEQVQNIMKNQDKEDLFLRLYVQSAVGGIKFGMALDTRRADDDHTCFVKDVEVAIDRISFPYLNGATVDFLQSDSQTGFQINSPNAELIAASACNSCSGDAGCC